MARPLINVPAKVKRGQVFEIKTLISHIMETGFRFTTTGDKIPRDIVTTFSCSYNGEEIFRADLYPAISANPFFDFLHRGDRKRHARLQMDRRQRLCRNRHRQDRGGMSRQTSRVAPIIGRATAVAFMLVAIASAANGADIPLDQRRSGYLDLGRDSKAMQDDDTINPATLWVQDGEALWNQKAGAANRACADCHQDATVSMKGVAARYPAFSAARNGPVDLEQRINLCRSEHQQAPAVCL